MRRREFLTLLGCMSAWPLAARAQQPDPMAVVGYLGTASPAAGVQIMTALRQSLAEAGYVEGRNVVIDSHWAEGRYDRLPALAAEMVRRQVAVIIATGGTAAALAAKAATATIPLVFSVTDDPVALGLVKSFARPGGNATGVTFLLAELGPKQLGLLRELVPVAMRIGLLINPSNTTSEAQARNVTHPDGYARRVRKVGGGFRRWRAHRRPARKRQSSDRSRIRNHGRKPGRCAPDRHRPLLLRPPPANRHAGDAPCDPCHPSGARERGGGGPHELKPER